MQHVSIGLTAATAAALLITCPQAAATSQTDLADWLSKAAGHVEAIHKAENDAYSLIASRGHIDDDKLKVNCDQLRDATEALRDVMPSPNPTLTAEVQQAIDNFDSASESCAEYFGVRDADKLNEFWLRSRNGEQHLSSADSIVVSLTKPQPTEAPR